MALEMVIGYLVALALPLWLVVEGIKHMERTPEQRETHTQPDRRTADSVTGAAAGPIRPGMAASGQPRVAA
jgi:hypothetical protein